jgi:hypothetical protein
MQRQLLQKQQQRSSSSSLIGSSSTITGANASSAAASNKNGKISDKMLKMEQQQQRNPVVSGGVENSSSSVTSLLLKECQLHLQTRQYASCELLTGYLLSSFEADTNSLASSSSFSYATALELFGDCLSEMNPPQFRRAVSYYRHAVTTFQHVNNNNNEDSNDIVGSIVSVQLKMFRCLMKLKSYKEAYEIFNNLLVQPGLLPPRLRTFDLSMEFATLCVTIDLEKDARHWYLDALRLNPYALEAIEMLAILATEQVQVQLAVQTGLEHKKRKQQQQQQDGQNHHPLLLPLQDIIMAQFQAACNHNPTALSKYRSLAERFPNNINLLSKIAVLEVRWRYT